MARNGYHGGFAARRAGAAKGAHAVRWTQAQAEQAWRSFCAAVETAAADKARMPASATAVAEARRVCAGVGLPVEGEDAKAAAMALLEYARTLPHAGEERRGWQLEAMAAAARHIGAMLDQARNAVFAHCRSQTGSD